MSETSSTASAATAATTAKTTTTTTTTTTPSSSGMSGNNKVLLLSRSNSSSSSSLAKSATTTTTTTNSFWGTTTSTIQQRKEREKEQQAKIDNFSNQNRSVYLASTFSAGVGSGALASIICAPLDLVRTRMQVWKTASKSKATAMPPFYKVVQDIIKTDGYVGCFRGLGATLVTVPLFWGVYFPLYDETKRAWTNYNPNTNPSIIHCGSAVITGAVADIICNPLFVIRTRLQTQALHNMQQGIKQKVGIIATARDLYYIEGNHNIKIFYRGMTANMLGLSHVAVQFPVYEQLKLIARSHRDNHQETALDLLLASGFAKMTACLLTYPHEVIRSRMMDARTTPSFTGTVKSIYTKEGMIGFYSGLPVTLLRVIPNCCITFISYEFFLRWSQEAIMKHQN